MHTDLGTPFDRALGMIEHPDFQDPGGVRMHVFSLARGWEYWTTTTNRSNGWQSELDKIVTGVESEIRNQQSFLKQQAAVIEKMTPERRERYEKGLGKRDLLRKGFLAELEGILPQVKETVAAIKKKG